PAYTHHEFRKQYLSGEIKKYTAEECTTIYKELAAWQLAKARNLFTPNNKSAVFFLEYALIKAIFGGNRSGKTVTCATEVIMMCEGWHPLQRANLEILATKALNKDVRNHASIYLDEKKWYRAPPIAARCEVVDFPAGCEKIAGPTVLEWATRSELKTIAFDNEKKRKFEWKNGSFLEFMSHDQDLESHGGVSRDVIWEDEEPPSEIHQENLMRVLDSEGHIVLGMTAVKGYTWVKDAVWDEYEKGKPNIYAVKMRTIENPIITEKMVETIREECLDKDEEDIRLEGEFRARGGLVYFMAKDKRPWIIEPFDIPEDKGIFILNIDTHIATPHGLLWQWIDYEGLIHDLIDEKPNYYNVKEMFMNGTMSDINDWIKVSEDEMKRKHDYFLLEPAAFDIGKDQTRPEEKTLADQFFDMGHYPERASKDLSGGIQFVRSLLLVKNKHPRLMTFKTCGRLRWERGKYQTPDLTGRAKDRRAPSDKPADKDDHLVECERRGCSFVNDIRIEIGVTHLVDEEEYDPRFSKRKKKIHTAPDGTILNVDFEERDDGVVQIPYNSPEDM
ncbi:hypothetical protein LCGC14_2247100, partial [marine sediment metagenome]